MKIVKIHIHHYRSIIDAEIEAHDYLMFVGANVLDSFLRCVK